MVRVLLLKGATVRVIGVIGMGVRVKCSCKVIKNRVGVKVQS